MATLNRNCVICHNAFRAKHPDIWTCSSECYGLLQAKKQKNAEEAAELEAEEPIAVSFEFGTSEAEKARQALAGLDEVATVDEAGKALYRPELGALDLAELANRLHDLAVKAEKRNWDYAEDEPRTMYVAAFSSITDQLISECLERIRGLITPTTIVGARDGHDSEVVRQAADLPPDDEADGYEEAEAGAPGEGGARGGRPEGGVGSDPVVVQGDVGDGVPGDGVDDGPPGRGAR